ncbi:MAG: site-2 protease family protein, partial [Opitutaceae bacterium]|nr:site-2 protease family protein [Opitutaceae bacterium]
AFISILIHEFGHALTGLRLGASNVQVSLYGMDGLARFDGAFFSRKSSILMTAAGPGASIALAGVFFVVGKFLFSTGFSPSYAWELVRYFFNVVILINIFWSIINLLPVLPLDGGQILSSILGPGRVKQTCVVSFMTIGALAIFLWMWTGSYYNLIIMGFLASHTLNVWQSNSAR